MHAPFISSIIWFTYLEQHSESSSVALDTTSTERRSEFIFAVFSNISWLKRANFFGIVSRITGLTHFSSIYSLTFSNSLFNLRTIRLLISESVFASMPNASNLNPLSRKPLARWTYFCTFWMLEETFSRSSLIQVPKCFSFLSLQSWWVKHLGQNDWPSLETQFSQIIETGCSGWRWQSLGMKLRLE